ncbi:leucine-rich repeat and calponin homology domain-containing protein 4-like, partial [Mustelus asterias]
ICTKGKIHIFKYLNIEACKAVPDLSDLERSIRPHGFSSCLSDELCGSQQHSDLDSGFNSVDSGSKRWSGNESTDEFTDLSLRMVEISREQRQLRDSRIVGQAENSTNIDLELERIGFMDSALDGEEEKGVKSEAMMTTPSAGRSPRTAASEEDQKQRRSSYSERLPPNGASEEVSPGKDEAHREGEERRRPETLQIWQAREKQLQSQSAERRERGPSVSSMARTSLFSLQSPNSLSDPSSKAASG